MFSTLFVARRRELRLYLSFLRSIDVTSASLSSPSTILVDAEVRRVMRASFFLVLYNAVESMVRGALDDLHAHFRATPIRFESLRQDWQQAIAKQQLRRLFTSFAGPGSHYERVANLMNMTALGTLPPHDPDELPLSGNVDQDYVNKLCARHAIAFHPPRQCRGGTDLEVVRRARNDLAHGFISFADLGKDYTSDDLALIQRRSMLYLGAFLCAIRDYKSTAGFLVARATP
jgi:hypothetical protein